MRVLLVHFGFEQIYGLSVCLVIAGHLGYADQGHFIRDFKSMFGEPPAWYAQRY